VETQLSAEDKRTESLNSRATSLIGFSGVGITLTASLLTGKVSELAGDTRTTAVICVFAAYAGLLAAIIVLLGAVLFPRTGPVIAIWEIREWPTFEFVASPKVFVEGRIMVGLINALAVERARNKRKGAWLRGCYACVIAAVVAIGILGGIILWHAR
jgi:hypothetical protein